MEYHITADWVENLAFDTHINEHTLRMDSSIRDAVSTGPSPKRTLLATLITCTGMDVVSLLKKMRVPFTALRIEAEAPLSDEHPKTFTQIHLRYIVTGREMNRDKIEKAVDLSQERYCGVSAMLRKHCPITWEIEVREE